MLKLSWIVKQANNEPNKYEPPSPIKIFDGKKLYFKNPRHDPIEQKHNKLRFISPKKFLEIFKTIEKKLGRKKSFKNSPRTCDIDIISYKDKIISGDIIIPHERMSKRSFVLIPLFEIAPNYIHPKTKKSIRKLIFSLPIKDIRSIKQI